MKILRLIILLSVATLSGYLVYSEAHSKAQAPELDHVTVFVRDMNTSVQFYEKVMELQPIPEPFHDGRHSWFRAGAHDQLHVVSGAKQSSSQDIEVHMAFRVPSLPQFLKHLDDHQVKYRSFAQDKKEPTSRPDGVKQVYLQDPDGYWIEVNDDKF